MERKRIREFQDSGEVETLLLLSKKEVLKKRDGAPYLSLLLRDETGVIEGRMWENVEGSLSFEPGDVLRIKGEVKLYSGKRQLVVREMEKEEMDSELFLPVSRVPPDRLKDELLTIVEMVEDPDFKGLLEAFWRDEKFVERALVVAGGKRVHHSYKGGLVEHLVSLAKAVLQVWEVYQSLNRDLLIAGALLHDVGKVDELEWDSMDLDYTLEGRLLGHVILGIQMVTDKMKELSFPRDKGLRLLHIIASHHGEPEQGALKRPKFKEALVIHYLDQLDSKISGFEQFIQQGEVEGPWAGYHRVFQRYILKD